MTRASEQETGDSRAWRAFFVFTIAALAIRLLLLVVDHQPRFFSDSATYLLTELEHSVPVDRSWLYGLAVNALLARAPHLLTLMVAQTLLSAILCGAAATLCAQMGVRRIGCWIVLALLSIEPMSLFYDRAMMTDAPGSVMAWLAVFLAIASLRYRSVVAALTSAVGFVLAVSLRTALAPIAVSAPTLALAIGAWEASRARGWRPVLAPALLSATTALLLVGYAALTGQLTYSRPSLNPGGGALLLGVVAPIVRPIDLAGEVPDPDGLLAGTGWLERSRRECEVWCDDGLYQRLKRRSGDWHTSAVIAEEVAKRSIHRDPLGFAMLSEENARDYLTPAQYPAAFYGEFGLRSTLTGEFVSALRARVRDAVTDTLGMRPSPLSRFLRSAVYWLSILAWLAVFAPLLGILVAFTIARERRVELLMLALTALAYDASTFAFSLKVIPRFLLPTIPFSFCLLAVVGEHLVRMRKGRRALN